MFCLPITILLNHLTAALAPKALLNKPLPCKAGRHREPRDVDNPVLCCSCGTAACLQGVHRQGEDEGFGSTGARTCFLPVHGGCCWLWGWGMSGSLYKGTSLPLQPCTAVPGGRGAL